MDVPSIEEFRKTPLRFVVSISGGGAAFISDYLAVPGASGSLIEALVPYSKASTDAFLGKAPESYCSEHTARLLASAAYARARALEPQTDPETLLGIGVTAALVSNRPKKGEHRVYFAAISRFGTFSATLELTKDARDRDAEERLAADFILSAALFVAQKFNDRGDDVWREYSAPLTVKTRIAPQPQDRATISWALLDPESADFLYGPRGAAEPLLRALRFTNAALDRALLAGGETIAVSGDLSAALATRRDAPTSNAPRVFFPGSFNPPHSGHVEMARFSGKRAGTATELEISARNVDKPPLDALELLRRVKGIAETLPGASVWISNAPRFVEKAELMPGSTFVMGADTIVRLADPKYEGNSIERRDAVLARLTTLHTRFIVYNRRIAGRLESFDELRAALPPALLALCEFADDAIDDVSSTQLRQEKRP